jgi:hypothetical protein
VDLECGNPACTVLSDLSDCVVLLVLRTVRTKYSTSTGTRRVPIYILKTQPMGTNPTEPSQHHSNAVFRCSSMGFLVSPNRHGTVRSSTLLSCTVSPLVPRHASCWLFVRHKRINHYSSHSFSACHVSPNNGPPISPRLHTVSILRNSSWPQILHWAPSSAGKRGPID